MESRQAELRPNFRCPLREVVSAGDLAHSNLPNLPTVFPDNSLDFRNFPSNPALARIRSRMRGHPSRFFKVLLNSGMVTLLGSHKKVERQLG